jgi:Skp family chaperone for outer membrane proteins
MLTTRLALLLVSSLALLACNTTSRGGEIDTSLLVQVPEDQRARIDEARLEIGRRGDELARAQRDISMEEDALDIIQKEREVADARVEEADARVELAREQGVGTESIDSRNEDVEGARAFRRWVEARIAKQEARIDRARADLERARAREELAKAHLQLLQARALEDLGRPDTADMDVDAYQRRFDRLELDVGDAEIAYESAERRADLRDSIVADRSEAVPARFRSGMEHEDSRTREAAAEREARDRAVEEE